MIRRTFIGISVVLTLTAAVLWPASHFRHSTWYGTIQTRPLAGYWCGYALVDGDLVVQWDSPKPPTITPMGVMTTSGSGFVMLDGKRVQLFPLAGSPPSPSGARSGNGTTPAPTVQPFYGTHTTLELAFLGWKLEYNRATRVGYHRMPLPMLALLFACCSLLLGVQGPLLRRRRRVRGLCVKCGYDLTGNESGVCPECGTRT